MAETSAWVEAGGRHSSIDITAIYNMYINGNIFRHNVNSNHEHTLWVVCCRHYVFMSLSHKYDTYGRGFRGENVMRPYVEALIA